MLVLTAYRLYRASALRIYSRACVKRQQSAAVCDVSLRRWSSRGPPPSKQHQELYAQLGPHTHEQFVFPDWDSPVEREALEEPLCQRLQERGLLRDDHEAQPVRGPQLRSLEREDREERSPQLTGLEEREPEEHSLIHFHDEGYPLNTTSKPKKKKTKQQHKVYGSPDAQVAFSSSSCSGCGALMHCTDPQIPGYLPSEKYKVLVEQDKLKKAICQRCYLIQHHQRALSVSMSSDQYRAVVSRLKSETALIVLIVDLLDLPHSIVPDLPELVGKNKRIVVLGNKLDLLPRDAQNYLQRIRRQLMVYCADMGISGQDTRDYHLISAKTGYGIEKLISSLQSSWRYKGDVYLVGMANAGKSTLFNTLLESDYCKSRASDVILKATISPWPGTTLNLLKFPILNPTAQRMSRRAERLKQASAQTEDSISHEELQRIKHFSRQGYLIGHIGRTFKVNQSPRKDLVEFDADSLSFGEDVKEDAQKSPAADTELSYNEIKDAHWCCDTPGIMKEHDVLSLLTEQEVKLVVPTQAITPRTFVIKPGMVLFLGALARIDYLQGENSCWLTVVASSRIPVHITSLDKADGIYEKHAGKTLLAVPCGGEERMKSFPPLVAQDFQLQGHDCNTAVADIKISSAGWVAVTADTGDQLLLRTRAPEAAGVCLRTPPLLPHIVNLRGQRIPKSPAYKTRKPDVLVDTGLSVTAAERLNSRRKK